MTHLVWGVLFLSMLTCALKLSVTRRLREMPPVAAIAAGVPLVAYPYAVRASLTEIERALSAPDALNGLSVLLAIDALLSLVLTFAAMDAGVGPGRLEGSGGSGATSGACRALWALTVVALAAAFLTGSRTLWAAATALLAGALARPWLRPLNRGFRGVNVVVGHVVHAVGRLVAVLWPAFTPAGLVAIAGVQIHLLHAAASGADLRRLTFVYSGALFGGLCVVAALLRAVLRRRETRLHGAVLGAFALLLLSVFTPQFFSRMPPPASMVFVNWPATAAFAALVVASTWGAARKHRCLRWDT